MNLTDMMKEASIIDHSWYGKGMLNPGEPTFNPKEEGMKKHNNIKPELEVEWGGAGPDVDLDEPAGEVARNIPEEDLADAKAVILFARDMQNRGRTAKDITRELKAKYDQGTLRKAQEGLRKQFGLDGIVGCIAVDGRGYGSCQEAIKVASCSPYKNFIKYVIGCQCGDPHMIPANEKGSMDKVAKSSGNGMDDFLGASESNHKVAMVSHCRSTMLPILSFRGDLDDSETDQTLITLMNVGGLPEGEYQKLWQDRHNNKLTNNMGVVQAAFRQVNARKQKSTDEFAQPSNTEFMMDMVDNPLDIDAIPVSDIGDIDNDIAPLDMDSESFESLDVDIENTAFEPEFEGVDELELNEIQPVEESMDIDLGQDMELDTVQTIASSKK